MTDLQRIKCDAKNFGTIQFSTAVKKKNLSTTSDCVYAYKCVTRVMSEGFYLPYQ